MRSTFTIAAIAAYASAADTCALMTSSTGNTWDITGLAKSVPKGPDGIVPDARFTLMYHTSDLNWNYCEKWCRGEQDNCGFVDLKTPPTWYSTVLVDEGSVEDMLDSDDELVGLTWTQSSNETCSTNPDMKNRIVNEVTWADPTHSSYPEYWTEEIECGFLIKIGHEAGRSLSTPQEQCQNADKVWIEDSEKSICATREQVCTRMGNIWTSDKECKTPEEIACKEEGSTWTEHKECKTPEDLCTEAGSTWTAVKECKTPEEVCTEAGSTWTAENVCKTLEEIACTEEGSTWTAGECKTPEEVCTEAGSTWTAGECKTPEEVCTEAGSTWTTGECKTYEIGSVQHFEATLTNLQATLDDLIEKEKVAKSDNATKQDTIRTDEQIALDSAQVNLDACNEAGTQDVPADCSQETEALNDATLAANAAVQHHGNMTESEWNVSEDGLAANKAAISAQIIRMNASVAVATAQAAVDAAQTDVIAAKHAIKAATCTGVWTDSLILGADTCVTEIPESTNCTTTCLNWGICATDESICAAAYGESLSSGLIMGLILAILAAIAIGIIVYCFCCKGEDDDYQKQN